MSQAVLRWGNSQVFRIHSAVARQMGIDEGAELDLRVEGMVVEKRDKAPEFNHDDLVRALRKTKRTLINFGRPCGNELL